MTSMARLMRSWIIPAYLLSCLLLGGASAAGYLANLLLQWLAIALLFAALLRRPTARPQAAARHLAWIGVAAILVILIQLMPLPPSLWTQLPGREEIASGYRLLGIALPSLSISLDPTATIRSALALLPGFAVLLGMMRLGSNDPRKIAQVIVAVACVSIFVGLIQILGGPGSPAYFYEITNDLSTVGFFANANHLATLLVIAIPMATALFMQSRVRGDGLQRRSALYVVFTGIACVLFAGALINGSIAGLSLSFVMVAGSAAMLFWRNRPAPGWIAWVAAALMTAAVGLAATGSFSSELASMGQEDQSVARYASFTHSLQAAHQYFPVGSGVGTFKSVYPWFEDPNVVSSTYVIHVHNDYIEILLEAGISGVLLILGFLVWWARRTLKLWGREGEKKHFARAATIATGAMLAHSVVDYPLRTAALMSVFVALCAMMADLEPPPETSRTKRTDRPRHLSAD